MPWGAVRRTSADHLYLTTNANALNSTPVGGTPFFDSVPPKNFRRVGNPNSNQVGGWILFADNTTGSTRGLGVVFGKTASVAPPARRPFRRPWITPIAPTRSREHHGSFWDMLCPRIRSISRASPTLIRRCPLCSTTAEPIRGRRGIIIVARRVGIFRADDSSPWIAIRQTRVRPDAGSAPPRAPR